MRVNIETKRLILRNLVSDDYEAAFKWCGDPKVNKYMIYPLYRNAEDVRKWIETLNPDDPDNYDVGFLGCALTEMRSMRKRTEVSDLKQRYSERNLYEKADKIF